MTSHLPVTPVEALDISSRVLRLRMNVACASAELFGYWRHPRKDAATDFAEMTPTDIFYWVYKCKNPVLKAEKGEKLSDLLTIDHSIVGLPKGFQKSSLVTFGAGGDLLQADGLEQSKDILFENVADLLFDQSVSYANLESPVTTQPLVKEVISDKAAPIECCSREQFDVLTSHKGKRFDVLNTSNNHSFDMGIEGIETSLQAFSETDILNIGTHKCENEYGRGKILLKDGIKLGFTSDTFGLNGRELPEEDKYRIHTSKLLSKFVEPDLSLSKQQIDDCKAKGCDFIIASLHWGFEFEFFPRKRQIEAARALVEYGADAVICHHPHVIQPVEYYRTQRDPDRVAVIAYSMGSLTWGYTAPHIVLSLILNMTLAKGEMRGRPTTYIEKSEITPIFRSAFSWKGKILTRLEKLAGYLDRPTPNHPREYVEKIDNLAKLVLS